MPKPSKVALVHDWLTGMRGGEKVLEVFCGMFPEADIFTLLHVPGSVSEKIESHKIKTSFLQSIPGIRNSYRYFLPLMPRAVESFDLSAYDLVVSTSHCVAKGAVAGTKAVNVSYCFTPMRYIWDQFDLYFGPERAGPVVRGAMRILRPVLQRWDRKSSKRVTHFIADSAYVAARIRNFYGRQAEVIYPHADTEFYAPGTSKPGDFHLIVSALAPYKRLELAVEAFNRMGKKLKIIGSGPSLARLMGIAGPNIEFLGWRSNEEIRDHYRACAALIFPGTEDFGIVPLEAMACGRPVVAYGEGGALETVSENASGIFFREASARSLTEAVRKAERMPWDGGKIRARALEFSREKFVSRLKSFFDKILIR
ncbi:MAG: hypothetical protein A3A86_02125 [Elusimicrobia bacterium RIFCSPLOWO2_01_FULL_60_11]|nr:MAG: hypothetical protein A3A86_02125 [Elusimicrobia bacterium RIFCSPLOWO2_01_FULL_60_11]